VSLFEADLETKRKADALLTKLAHANPEMKVEVMERLGELGGDAGPYLASLLDKIDRGDLSFVTAAIVKCKNSRAIPILAKVTESPEAIVRTAAASALGGLANDSVTPVLQPLLKDKDPTVRATAISSLKEVGDRRAFEAVLGVLADRDRQARAQAIQTSRELAEKLSLAAEFADALGRALESAPAPAQFDLMQALAQTKASEKWSLIAPFLRSEQPELREAAALALGKLGNPRAADDLAAQARTETEAQVKVQLAVAARLLAAKAAIDPLIRWLRDESASVRAESVVSLHELTAQRFGNDATKWEDWRAQNRDQ
jgi:HEAT repeat protein